jgi:Ca2+-binding RTX toxin-like protein
LILGDGVTVYVNGVETLVSDGARSVRTYFDRPTGYTYKDYGLYWNTPGQYNWNVDQRSYDAAGRLDTRWISYDDHSILFFDYDQAGQYDWTTVTTRVHNTHWKNVATTVFDDSSKTVWQNDKQAPASWDWQEAAYARTAALDSVIVHFDDATSYLRDIDALNFTALREIMVSFDANGSVSASTIKYDNGTNLVVSWVAQNSVSGTGTLTGTAGSDKIVGGAGGDSLVGLGGPDYMEGRGGNDTYYVDDPGDFAFENPGAGVDTVNSSVSYALPQNIENLYLTGSAFRGAGNELNNFISGTDGPNRLDGERGNDWLVAGAGNDTVVGGLGADKIEGGLGVDTLYGGAGADTFIWRFLNETSPSSQTADLIMDFASIDRLDVSRIDANVSLAGLQHFSFIGANAITAPGQIRYLATGSETRILLNVDADTSPEGVIRLAGSHKPMADWFIV